MAKFEVKGMAGRKIFVQPSQLNNNFVTITIESRDGTESLVISLDANTANAFANAVEIESVNCHAKQLKQAVQHG